MEDSDQPGYPPSQISLHCPHEWKNNNIGSYKLSIDWAHSEDSDQTGLMPRLRVFAGRTYHFVSWSFIFQLVIQTGQCRLRTLTPVCTLACSQYRMKATLTPRYAMQPWTGWSLLLRTAILQVSMWISFQVLFCFDYTRKTWIKY